MQPNKKKRFGKKKNEENKIYPGTYNNNNAYRLSKFRVQIPRSSTRMYFYTEHTALTNQKSHQHSLCSSARPQQQRS